jgi:serine O-acetyltransferase
VSEAVKEVLPYTRRVKDALGALRALVTDNTPTNQLESDLRVVHGIVAALVGGDKATVVIERLPAVRCSVATDIAAAYEKDPSANSYGEIIAAYPSILAVSTYRVAHVFYEIDEKVVARIMSEDAHTLTGIDIHPGATIGSHFFIDHGTGVVIGDRVKLYHGVTLAAFSNKAGRRDLGKKRHPTLEDDVTIYPNATILGGDTVIGAGSVIGGNVWLTRSVPRYTRVTIDPSTLQLHQNPIPEVSEEL